MQIVCPECKNEVMTSQYGELQSDQVIECNTCGITLMLVDLDGTVEIVDEGK